MVGVNDGDGLVIRHRQFGGIPAVEGQRPGVAAIIFAYYAVRAEVTATLAKPLRPSGPGSGIDHPTS